MKVKKAWDVEIRPSEPLKLKMPPCKHIQATLNLLTSNFVQHTLSLNNLSTTTSNNLLIDFSFSFSSPLSGLSSCHPRLSSINREQFLIDTKLPEPFVASNTSSSDHPDTSCLDAHAHPLSNSFSSNLSPSRQRPDLRDSITFLSSPFQDQRRPSQSACLHNRKRG